MNILASGVDVSFGPKKILKNLSLDAGEKRRCGIIGPNGSGKSTLLRTLHKALEPDRGRVALDGRDLKTYGRRELASEISVVPQHQGEIDLTVEETVQMGRYPHKKLFERLSRDENDFVREVMTKLKIWHLKDRNVQTLSGGERQLTLLARAMVQDTPVMLLDEPTNHLDIYHQVLILDFLKTVDKLVVVVFHDLNLASGFCDRLYLMNDGRVVAEGDPASILTRENILEVYGLDANIMTNPATGRPLVVI